MKKIFISFLLIFLFSQIIVQAAEKTTLYFFHTKTCPHCISEEQFLDKIESKYPDLEIKSLDVGEAQNRDLWRKMAEGYGTTAGQIPLTFIGDEYILGFGSEETTGKLLEEKINDCIQNGCIDPIEKISDVDIKNGSFPIEYIAMVIVAFGALGIIYKALS